MESKREQIDVRRALAYLKVSEPGHADEALDARAGLASYTDASGEPVQINVREADLPVLRPLSSGLAVAYLVDAGESFRYVQARDLEAVRGEEGKLLGVDGLHALALQNLASALSEQIDVQAYGEIYALTCGGNFEASVLLLDSFWEQVHLQLERAPVVAAVPARDVLAFCSANSRVGVQGLRDIVGRVWPNGDHLLTRQLFVRRDQTWQPYA